MIVDYNARREGLEEGVSFCRTLEKASRDETEQCSTLSYGEIRVAEMIPLTAEEEAAVASISMPDFDHVDRLGILKADITLTRSSATDAIKGVFLLPHYLDYRCENEAGMITLDNVKVLILQVTRKARRYTCGHPHGEGHCEGWLTIDKEGILYQDTILSAHGLFGEGHGFFVTGLMLIQFNSTTIQKALLLSALILEVHQFPSVSMR